MAGNVSTNLPLHLARSLSKLSLILAATALFAVLPGVIGRAEGLPPRQATVLVLVQSNGKSDNTELNALIEDSFRMELEAKGMRTLPADEHAADDRAAAALAAKNSADFALWGTYVQTGENVKLSARWIGAGGKNAAGQASRSGVLDFSFDALVTSLVDEIVESQKQSLASLPPATAVQTPAPGAAAASTAAGPVKEPRIPPFAFSLGSSPFIATFTAMNYFPVGISASIAGHYQMRAPGGLFGVGVTSGLSGFHGKGAYTEADFFVVPIGVDVLYGTLTGSAIDFFVHAAGGPAIFAATLVSGESLTKVIPFVSGGVGISLSLFDMLGISLEGGYTVYFDSPDPIMGFAPALSVDLRL